MIRAVLVAMSLVVSDPAIAQEFNFTAENAYRRINELAQRAGSDLRLVSGGCKSGIGQGCSAFASPVLGMSIMAEKPGGKATGMIIIAGGQGFSQGDAAGFMVLASLAMQAGSPKATKEERANAFMFLMRSVMDKPGDSAESPEIDVSGTKVKFSRSKDIGFLLSVRP